ncbi:hypothetical protein XENTR_v10022349 [Xenopus tropicalis]|nr:hypothetical protein XENTR_v10022349 [Xenopus tropicalis]
MQTRSPAIEDSIAKISTATVCFPLVLRMTEMQNEKITANRTWRIMHVFRLGLPMNAKEHRKPNMREMRSR